MKLNKVSERVFANWDGLTGGNVGIVELDDSVLVVDAQYPGSARKFREAITETTSKKMSHLLLTHVHGDHVYGNMVFEDLEIVSHVNLKKRMAKSLENEWAPGAFEKMLEDIKKDTPERSWLFEGLRIVLPTETFTDKWERKDVEFIYMGGHTDCSSVVYVKDDKALYAGDLLFVNRFPWAGDPTVNPDTWITAFERMLKMNVDHVVPGHGPLCDLDEVEKQLNWMKEVREIMKGLIENGASEEEAISHEYPELYPTDRPERQKLGWSRWYMVWSS
ncbi:MAG: MBL fold metallo-hydrolase [Candidatus Bathyarchaeota archaeon]|nr:MBL fold metallo-hydrolase [Candidatus Bathyarchaeota archaeon]